MPRLTFQSLNESVQNLLDEERRFVSETRIVGIALRDRQIRVQESELAARLRARLFPGELTSFVNSRGPDIESDSHKCKIQIKYFCGKSVQGGMDVKNKATEDWKWLTKHGYGNEFDAFHVLFLPTAATGYGVQGAGGQKPEAGKWRFRDCLSFTPENDESFKPFWPIIRKVVFPKKGKKKQKQPKLEFRDDPVTQCRLTHEAHHYYLSVAGDPLQHPLWAVVYGIADPLVHQSPILDNPATIQA